MHQTFTTDTIYANLAYAEVYDIAFTAVASPPPPPPPAYPSGKVPVVFTVNMTFSESQTGFRTVREIRDEYISTLMAEFGACTAPRLMLCATLPIVQYL